MRFLPTEAAARLGEARKGFSRAALSAVYGQAALDAADRGDYRSLLAQCGDDRLGAWTRLFVIGVPVPAEAVVDALAPLGFDEARECGLVWGDREYLADWGAQFDGERLLFSDQRPNATGGRTSEHVLGIGGASRLLLGTSPSAARWAVPSMWAPAAGSRPWRWGGGRHGHRHRSERAGAARSPP